MEDLARWAIGLFVALVVGAGATGLFINRLRAYLKVPKPSGRDIPAWLTGVAERLFFVFVIAFDVEGGAIAMMAWIALKMLPSWELYVKHGSTNKPLAWTSLLGSLCSMFFALIGGLVVSGQMWCWF